MYKHTHIICAHKYCHWPGALKTAWLGPRAQRAAPPSSVRRRAGAAPYADEEGVANALRQGPGSAERPGIKKVLKTFPSHKC